MPVFDCLYFLTLFLYFSSTFLWKKKKKDYNLHQSHYSKYGTTVRLKHHRHRGWAVLSGLQNALELAMIAFSLVSQTMSVVTDKQVNEQFLYGASLISVT